MSVEVAILLINKQMQSKNYLLLRDFKLPKYAVFVTN